MIRDLFEEYSMSGTVDFHRIVITIDYGTTFTGK